MAIIGAIVGFLAGIAVAYWLVEKRLNQQKQQQLEQSRKMAEQIEIAHLSRMQETVESLQGEREKLLRKVTAEHEKSLRQVTTEHEKILRQVAAERDNNLRQVNSELEETHNSQLQETLQSLQEEHEHHLLRLADELHLNYQAQMEQNMQALQDQHEIRLRQTAEEYENREIEMQLTVESLQDEYESQLRAAQEQLQAHQAQMQATIESLQEQYEIKLKEKEILQPQSSQLTNQLNPTEFGEPFNETEFLPTQSIQLDPTEFEEQFNETEVLPPESIQLNQTEVGEQHQIARQAPSYSVAQLMGCVQSRDTEVRNSAAFALGRMAAANALRSDSQRVVETLGKLAQDYAPEVRQTAVEALGMIKSEKVIPLLQKALRDTDGAVAKSASSALNKFKFYPRTPAAKPKNVDVKKPKR
ncbi:MAG: HEAT repeat domain-containing protein [Microcoleus sp.]